MNRHGVEELVRDDDRWPGRYRVHGLVPLDDGAVDAADSDVHRVESELLGRRSARHGVPRDPHLSQPRPRRVLLPLVISVRRVNLRAALERPSLRVSVRRRHVHHVHGDGVGETLQVLGPPEQIRHQVPRPGPSSTIRTVDGFPMLSHVHAAHAPMSSPNACDTSGDVTKSPLSPKTSRCM